MMGILVLIASLLATLRASESLPDYYNIPQGFTLGVSTAAYQSEGAWNVSDKGENTWDRFTHQSPSPIADGSTGDVACDSYHKYNEDNELLSNLGVGAFRLSIAWSRILPGGFANRVSREGVRHYRKILDDLAERNIEAFVTLYHWDHPSVLEELGGWTNELMATWFADYARVVFREFGDRVKFFATMNEPNIICTDAYGTGVMAPGKKVPGIGPYLCVHNMLKAHAMAYKLYNLEFRDRQQGKVGIAMSCTTYYPKYPEDAESAIIAYEVSCGWISNPIFSENGDYPEVMKTRIAENSASQGYPRSRLPSFTATEIADIRGSADFFGLNYYTSRLTETVAGTRRMPWYEDSGVLQSVDECWPRAASPWIRIFPKGMGDLLRIIKNRYGNPLVYVLENGVSDDGTSIDDPKRINYLHDYIRELLIAVNRDRCNVAGYFVWGFLDDFEWENGYKHQFGLVSVDFDDPERRRTPKRSYYWYKELVTQRTLPPRASEYDDVYCD